VLHEHRLDPLLAEAEARVRISPPAESAAVRTMYKRVGIDPTKTRPSNDALLRRVRKGDAIPRINSAVDVVNWCSLEFQLPYGLYDFSKVSGPVEMRLGAEGEKYAGIRKDEVNVVGRITVADSSGAFGKPTSDSSRKIVTPETTELLVIF
jgi:DNA/RNA-binding domain of Phe-tRNA-synthetase-like protein